MKKVIIILSFVGIATFGMNTANAENFVGNRKANCNNAKKSLIKSAAVHTSADISDLSDTILVKGACGMCKSRIESTVKKLQGITSADWDQTTHVLKYTYTGTVEKIDVSNALLEVGHDTEYGRAQDKVYDKLPGCCKYRK